MAINWRKILIVFLDHVRKHGGDDIILYLNSLGGSPLIAKGIWDETKFDVGNLFDLEPRLSLVDLAGQVLVRCKYLKRKKREFLCLKKAERVVRPERSDLLKIFKRLAVEKSMALPAIRDYKEYLKIQNFNEAFDDSEKRLKIKIKDFSVTFPHVKINWLKFFNDQLLAASQVTMDELIVVDYPKALNRTMLLMSRIDKR